MISGEAITLRWQAVHARVAAACARAGRSASEVCVIAVSKTQPAAAIRAAIAAGAREFGENYAQELAGKLAELAGEPADPPIRWHFIGRLQRNKAKLVAGRVALVHAVDSAELAEELARRAGGQVQPILLAVNLAGEASKGGISGDAAPGLARALASVSGCSLDGLMTMPPPSEDAEASRPYFEQLRGLRDRLQHELGRALPILSMGMSHDFEVAIGCGATHVRVGSAIFGSRS